MNWREEEKETENWRVRKRDRNRELGERESERKRENWRERKRGGEKEV